MVDAVKQAARTEMRRNQIMDRAASVLRQREYFGFSVDELCDALKMNKTTFYRYFDSKEQLLFDLHDRVMTELETLADKEEQNDGPAAEILWRTLKAQVIVALSPTTSTLTHAQLSVFPPRRRRQVIARRDQYEARIRNLIARAVAEGTFKECDARVQSLIIMGGLYGLQNWYRPGGGLSADALADEILRLFYKGLEKRPADEAGGVVDHGPLDAIS
jgi:AcrR family transcriptional regulator